MLVFSILLDSHWLANQIAYNNWSINLLCNFSLLNRHTGRVQWSQSSWHRSHFWQQKSVVQIQSSSIIIQLLQRHKKPKWFSISFNSRFISLVELFKQVEQVSCRYSDTSPYSVSEYYVVQLAELLLLTPEGPGSNPAINIFIKNIYCYLCKHYAKETVNDNLKTSSSILWLLWSIRKNNTVAIGTTKLGSFYKKANLCKYETIHLS